MRVRSVATFWRWQSILAARVSVLRMAMPPPLPPGGNQPFHLDLPSFQDVGSHSHRLLHDASPPAPSRSAYEERGALELVFVTFGALAVPVILVVGLALAVIKRRQSRRTHPGAPPRKTP